MAFSGGAILTIHIIRDAKVGLGYRTDIRLMTFYIEVDGEERLLVALMPHGCLATDQSDFSSVGGRTTCRLNCQSCQFDRQLELMTFEQLAEKHNIQFANSYIITPLTAHDIWDRVDFPSPPSVTAHLSQP